MRFALAVLTILLAGGPARGAQDPPVSGGSPAPAPSHSPGAPGEGASGAPPAAAPAENKPAAPPSKAAQNLARVLLTEAEWHGLLDRYAKSLSGQLSQSLSMNGEPVP